MYEGITIAEVETNDSIRSLVYGSNGKVVSAYYDEDGRRAIIDGGFTRLYYKWDSAGTDRYIVNAAAWLVNLERFSEHQLEPDPTGPVKKSFWDRFKKRRSL